MSKSESSVGKLPAIVGRVGNFSELTDRARRLVQRLPGGEFALEQVSQAEETLLRGLKDRLDRIDPPRVRGRKGGHEPIERVEASQPSDVAQMPPKGRLTQLLTTSQEQSREAAQEALFLSVLNQMVPDESRIFSALSDGTPYPMLQVVETSLVGGSARVVVDNISNVGKSAGVQIPAFTSIYLARLRRQGLVDVQGEDPQLKLKYEILESDESVRREMARIVQNTWRRGTIQRQTIVISDFGKALWQACKVEE